MVLWNNSPVPRICGLQSVGLQSSRRDWATEHMWNQLSSSVPFIPQPGMYFWTPVESRFRWQLCVMSRLKVAFYTPLLLLKLARCGISDPLCEYAYHMGFCLGLGMERKWPRVLPRILEQSQYAGVRIHPSGLIWFLSFLLSSHLFSFWFFNPGSATKLPTEFYYMHFIFGEHMCSNTEKLSGNGAWAALFVKCPMGSSAAGLRSSELPHPEGKCQRMR